jgi:CubicO group peptidase (beta-lactamase class C family)
VHDYSYPRGPGHPVDVGDGSGWLPNRRFTEVNGAAAGLAGDVPSLARWGNALLSGKIISAPLLRAMTSFHASQFWTGYGLGLARDSIQGHVMWGHTGDGDGSHTELWYLPRERVTIAISWNDAALNSEAPFLGTLLRTVLASR